MVQSYRIHKLLSSLVGQHTCPVSFSSTPFLMHQCRVVTCTSNSNSCGLSPCNVIGYKIYVWRYSVKTCAKPRARSSAMFSQPQVSAWKTEFQSDIIWFNSWFAMVTSGSCACDHVPDKNSSIVPARHPGSSMCHKPNVSKLHTSTDVGPFPHHIFNYHKRRFQDQRLIYLSNRVILFQLASASNVWFQEGNQISHVETHLRSVQNPYGFIIRDCTTLSLSLFIYIWEYHPPLWEICSQPAGTTGQAFPAAFAAASGSLPTSPSASGNARRACGHWECPGGRLWKLVINRQYP